MIFCETGLLSTCLVKVNNFCPWLYVYRQDLTDSFFFAYTAQIVFFLLITRLLHYPSTIWHAIPLFLLGFYTDYLESADMPNESI